MTLKRLKHGLILSMLSLNIFIQNLQEKVYLQVSAITVNVITSDSATEAIEAYSWYISAKATFWAMWGYHESSSDQSIESLKLAQSNSNSVLKMLKTIDIIMRCMSVLLFISIMNSLLWLSLDLKYRKHKIFTFGLITAAVFTNCLIHQVLTQVS